MMSAGNQEDVLDGAPESVPAAVPAFYDCRFCKKNARRTDTRSGTPRTAPALSPKGLAAFPAVNPVSLHMCAQHSRLIKPEHKETLIPPTPKAVGGKRGH